MDRFLHAHLAQPNWAMASAAGVSKDKLLAVQRQIAGAIQIGAPLYNAGDVAGCATVYRSLYDTLLADSEVATDPRLSSILNSQLGKLRDGAANENAWQLRYGFDAVLALSEGAATVYKPEAPVQFTATESLLQLSNPSVVTQLRAVNDGVMGGMSSGAVRFSDGERCAVFYGTVRTENNGGFASIRYQGQFSDVSGYTGLYVDCKATDLNKVWSLVVKDLAAVLTSVTFKASFQAPDKDYGRILIPFSAFTAPERFGRPVNRPSVDWAAPSAVGFMILKPDVGDFSLRIRELGVYK